MTIKYAYYRNKYMHIDILFKFTAEYHNYKEYNHNFLQHGLTLKYKILRSQEHVFAGLLGKIVICQIETKTNYLNRKEQV